jgi:tetratricopeptide (TPR) repeat protein
MGWTIGLPALLAMAGCAGLPWKTPVLKTELTASKTSSAQQTQVKVGGDGFALGDVDQPGCLPQPFVDRVEELIRAHRSGEAASWIHRYPDVALSVLREPGLVRVGTESFQTIAKAHDQQCCRGVGNAGWSATVAERTAHPQRFADYDQKRRQFMTHVQNGRSKEALQQELVEAARSVGDRLQVLDALRLTGIALILDGRPGEAIRPYQEALEQAGKDHPYQAVNLLLLVSDAHRRAGDPGSADRSWQDAARLAADLTMARPAVVDPILWERVAYLRPVNCPWPAEVRQALTQVNVTFGIVADARDATMTTAGNRDADESPLWIAVGHWRLARDEAQAALVALKRAESMSADSYVASRLQLSQSKALNRLGQGSAATAILIHLASNSNPLISHPAMAVLGTAKLQQGNAQQGFNLLRRAVEEGNNIVWPERPEAEADLGLAYLMIGDEGAGLRWLHQAQQSFEMSGQQEALAQCLENEAAFLEQAKKTDLAKAVRRRIESLRTS